MVCESIPSMSVCPVVLCFDDADKSPPGLCRYIPFSHTLFSPSLFITPTNTHTHTQTNTHFLSLALSLSQTHPHTHTIMRDSPTAMAIHTSSTTRQQHMKGERWWDRDVQVFKHPRISVPLTKATQTIALFFLSLPHTSNTHTHTHTHTHTQDVEGGEILQSTNGNGFANVFIFSVAMEHSTVKTSTLSLSQDQMTTMAKAVYSFQPMTGTGNFDLLNCSRVVSAIGWSLVSSPPNSITSVSPGPRLKAVRE